MKKTFTKLMSVFMALVMVLSVGAMPAFAAENTDEMTSEAIVGYDEEVSVLSSSDWIETTNNRYDTHLGYFTRQEYTPGLIFYGSSNMSISVGMSGISNSGLGTTYFTVQLVRLYEDGTYDDLYTYRVNGDANNTTLTWANVGAGAYQVIFTKDSTNLLWNQTIDSVTVIGLE